MEQRPSVEQCSPLEKLTNLEQVLAKRETSCGEDVKFKIEKVLQTSFDLRKVVEKVLSSK